MGTHPSYKERKIKDGIKVRKKKKNKEQRPSVLFILGKQVRDNSGSCPDMSPQFNYQITIIF